MNTYSGSSPRTARKPKPSRRPFHSHWSHLLLELRVGGLSFPQRATRVVQKWRGRDAPAKERQKAARKPAGARGGLKTTSRHLGAVSFDLNALCSIARWGSPSPQRKCADEAKWFERGA